jgi:hypothetical protein
MTKAVFLNIQRWSFPDESTGQVIEGAKLRASVPTIHNQSDLYGYVVTESRIDHALYEKLASQSQGLVGKLVELEMIDVGTRKGFEQRCIAVHAIK